MNGRVTVTKRSWVYGALLGAALLGWLATAVMAAAAIAFFVTLRGGG